MTSWRSIELALSLHSISWIACRSSLVIKLLNMSKMELRTGLATNKGKIIQCAPTVPTIRVPNICDKFHFRWPERVVFWKCQMSFKNATFTVNKKNRIGEFWSHFKARGIRVVTQHNTSLRLYLKTMIDLLQCIWRTDDEDFPSVEIIILDQSCREPFHWVFVQL